MADDFDVIIVGGGHAGANVVSELSAHKYSGSVALITDEPCSPYHRPPLSKAWLTGALVEKKLPIFKPQFYDKAGCDIILNTTVRSVDANSKAVLTQSGTKLHFNKLVLATGGRARKLRLPGSDNPKIFTLRSLHDSNCLKEAISTSRRIAIIGGGYIGLEVAASARSMDVSVVLFEAGNRILGRVACEQTSSFFESLHARNGVDLRLNSQVEGFEQVGEGIEIKAGIDSTVVDLVLVGIGLVPETSLAESADVTIDNGFVVNQYCQTSCADIYAVGDNANAPIPLFDGQTFRIESVQNAVEQAKTVASHICGIDVPYNSLPWFWSDQYDANLKIAGLGQGYDQIIERGEFPSKGISYCYFKEGRFIALDAINRIADFTASQKLISMNKKMDISKLRDPDIPLPECVSGE